MLLGLITTAVPGGWCCPHQRAEDTVCERRRAACPGPAGEGRGCSPWAGARGPGTGGTETVLGPGCSLFSPTHGAVLEKMFPECICLEMFALSQGGAFLTDTGGRVPMSR